MLTTYNLQKVLWDLKSSNTCRSVSSVLRVLWCVCVCLDDNGMYLKIIKKFRL